MISFYYIVFKTKFVIWLSFMLSIK